MAAPPPRQSPDAADRLTLAVVGASPGPLLLLDGDLNVIVASESFVADFGIDLANLAGRNLFSLGDGEWGGRHMRSAMDPAVSGSAWIDAYEIDLERPGRDTLRLVIQARRLDGRDLAQTRVLLAVSDVTEARAETRLRDEALAQSGILLKEVRHRVANSLQIIASVLLQNARKTHSIETRGHLQDAHNRVMSVAALERLLSAAAEADADVPVHDYLNRLCESIRASMIGDDERISLVVAAGAGTVPARVSVSLGLIITELVINALKHAFPDGRRGQIVVAYEARGPNWTLSVADDGLGMPADPDLLHIGMGTSIVEALARQLQASVATAPGHPGTTVSVEHVQLALISEDPIHAPLAPPVEPPVRSHGDPAARRRDVQ